MKYGYIPDVITPDQYVFGAQLSPQVLQENGQWDAFLPSIEHQNQNGVETYACTSFGTLSAVEMLAKRLYGDIPNFSDRFLAKISGTQYQKGNSPHTVAEYLRKLGVSPETEWPFDAKSFEEYYKEPSKKVYDLAKDFTYEFEFGHDWVPTTPQALKNALKSSPLGVSVFAWIHDPRTGHYIRPNGDADNHWCVLYGYVEGSHWKIFDSYDNTLKTVPWEYAFGVAKRYTLHAGTKKYPAIMEVLRKIAEALGLIQKQVEELPKPITPQVPVKYLWDTPEQARHSVRVLCDEEGLTLEQKNLICAVISCESGFRKNITNTNTNGTTDYGICQINDYWHIGKGKSFSSPEEVLNNPEKCVRWMIARFKEGNLKLWVCFSSKMYLKHYK